MTSTPSFSSILAEADSIVSGDRQGTYGSPEDCFGLIADLWNAWLGFGTITVKQVVQIEPLSASDVAVMMMLLKTARAKPAVLAAQPIKRDTLVDLAGYSACLARIQDALPVKKESGVGTKGVSNPQASEDSYSSLRENIKRQLLEEAVVDKGTTEPVSFVVSPAVSVEEDGA